MTYKIGEIASLLGISHETVRFYEKQGLIAPARDQHNGYRLYHAVDLNVLMRMRSYTSLGYTVNEAISLIRDGDLYDLSRAIGDKSAEIARQIEAQSRLLLCMQLRSRHLRRVSSMLGECVIENSPALYGIVYRNNLDISEDITTRRRVREWMEMRPFSEAMLMYDRAYWSDDCDMHLYRTGLCMDEVFAGHFGVDRDEKVIHFPSVRSVYSVTKVPYEADLSHEDRNHSFDHARKFIHERKLRVVGDSVGRTLHTSHKSGETVHYCEQWIPIE